MNTNTNHSERTGWVHEVNAKFGSWEHLLHEMQGDARDSLWKLLKPIAKPSHLIAIMKSDEGLRQEAWEQLKVCGDTVDFENVMQDFEPLRQEAWELIKQRPVAFTLLLVILTYEPLREEAWTLMKGIVTPNDRRDLFILIMKVPALRHEAWAIYKSLQPPRGELEEVMEKDELKEEATVLYNELYGKK